MRKRAGPHGFQDADPAALSQTSVSNTVSNTVSISVSTTPA